MVRPEAETAMPKSDVDQKMPTNQVVARLQELILFVQDMLAAIKVIAHERVQQPLPIRRIRTMWSRMPVLCSLFW